MKKWTLVAALVGIMILAGCGNNKPEEGAAVNTGAPKNEAAQDSGDKDIPMGDMGEAMKSGKLVKCVFENTRETEDGGKYKVRTTTYSKEGKFKNEILLLDKAYEEDFNRFNEQNHTVFDGEYTYSWSDNSKEGTKFSKDCLANIDIKNQPLPTADLSKEQKEEAPMPEPKPADDGGMKCSESSEKVDFSVPTDITFTDKCEEMKKSIESFNNMKAE